MSLASFGPMLNLPDTPSAATASIAAVFHRRHHHLMCLKNTK